MSKSMRKILRCDFKGCNEIAQWYREWKGDLLKLCTTHEVYFAKNHWGRNIELSKLDEDDLRYLEEKDKETSKFQIG